MGWFEKKEIKKEVPISLPKLPELPDFPKLDDEEEEVDDKIFKLPSFPTSSFGEKFSQNAIKEAVSGKKEESEVFADDEKETMQEPPQKFIRQEMPEGFGETSRIKTAEPIFVRIDKFDESSQMLEGIKKKVLEMEKMLGEIKKIKEEEEKELKLWEKNVQMIKEQIKKIEGDIFSKI